MGKHIIVSGHVQGVGFRFKTQRKARDYRLTGWVQNNPDGTVEMEIAGAEDDMNNFLNDVKSGFHKIIQVDDVHVNETDSSKQDFNDFTIQR